jgi:3-hydroxyisobutyrate dehydrogenase-like beta-hydroxyacid dehydrogenase
MTTVRSQTRDQTPRVTVIGMGTMGAAVAHRLLDSGLDVSVWSRHPTSALPLVEHGAKAYDEATDAVQQAEVVITLLPTAEATVDVMLGGQVLGAMPPNSIWAQMATIGVDATEKLAVEAEAVAPGVSFVDAPEPGGERPVAHLGVGSPRGGTGP